MQTLSAASCLLSQLYMFSIENNLLSYGGETFDLLICKLTENIDKLTYRGWSLWCMHLELLERWKYLSKGRSSFENVSYHFVRNLLYVYGFKICVILTSYLVHIHTTNNKLSESTCFSSK